jgi:cytochrome c-type protein NapC
MLEGKIVFGLVVAVALALLLFFRRGEVNQTRWGRIVFLLGAAVVPAGMSLTTLNVGFRESRKTRFCVQCHEMQGYGRSLFVDNRQALSAIHYQNRLISREDTCYACHKNYAMFGDLKAKLNGLRHVYVHYLGTIPEKPALYEPYPNSNCLHCHDDARSYLEAPAHAAVLSDLAAERTSCLACHRLGHDLQAHDFWQAQ